MIVLTDRAFVFTLIVLILFYVLLRLCFLFGLVFFIRFFGLVLFIRFWLSFLCLGLLGFRVRVKFFRSLLALFSTILAMLIIETMTILLNQVINIFVPFVARLHHLAVSLLDLFDLSLVLKNLALLFPQELLLFPMKFPVLFLLM